MESSSQWDLYLLRGSNDSGVDYTLVPYRRGRFLGLEKIASEIREMGGIGGVIAVRFAPVPMRIETYQFDCIGVRIRDGDSNFVPLILFKL